MQVVLENSRQIYPKDQDDPDNWSSTVLIAFPLQQWLRERASTLRYRYTACLVQCIC